MKIRLGLVVAMCAAVLVAQQPPAQSSKPAAKIAESHEKKTAQPGAKSAAKKHAFTPDEVQYGPPPPFVPPGRSSRSSKEIRWGPPATTRSG